MDRHDGVGPVGSAGQSGYAGSMWIAAIVVPLVLLAAPLWLAHLEDRLIDGVRPAGGPDPLDDDAAAAPEPAGSERRGLEIVPAPFARLAVGRAA
ncbi:hypothetical protein ACQPZQ_34915 [Pseudonocardia sp. CA-142604]|uniref:hypothetical protein n=1 Tax=Pseudonocardia sp. CA-142604 TaxID=3240024 RepID=UPI003D93B6A0